MAYYTSPMKVTQIYKRWPLVVILCTIVIAGVCAGILGSLTDGAEDLSTQTWITAILAVVALVMVALLVPRALRGGAGGNDNVSAGGGGDAEGASAGGNGNAEGAGAGQDTPTDASVSAHANRRENTIVIVEILLIALIAGICSALFLFYDGDSQNGAAASGAAASLSALDGGTLALRILFIVLLCATTGIFEEALFRGIVVPCSIARVTNDDPARPRIITAVVFSALVFGILHLASGSSEVVVDGANTGIIIVQGVGKVIEASLFGFCVAVLFVRTRTIWLVVIVHALYDILSSWASLIATGEVATTYLTGDVGEAVVIVLSAVLLLLPSYKSLQWLRRNGAGGANGSNAALKLW